MNSAVSPSAAVSDDPRLLRADLPDAPLALFDRWYDEAAVITEREAMTLSTLDADGAPDARTVLMRGVERTPGREGFTFYTNYLSAKGQGLALHPACSLLFYWGDLSGRHAFGGRQVRVRGKAEKLSAADSDAYFAGRPRLSQLGAWASAQSSPLENDDAMDMHVAEVEARFAGGPVPRPPHWGGYLVVVQSIEFWLGRAGRLHDRFRYDRLDHGWTLTRLAP